MASGMFGADIDELRRVSDAFDMRTTVIETARRRTTREVESIVWEGSDADTFKQRYASEVAAVMQQLEKALSVHRTDINSQADAQEQCSSANGGGQKDPWHKRLRDALINVARGVFNGIRTLVEAINAPFDITGPRLDFSLKIPGISDHFNREISLGKKDGVFGLHEKEERKQKYQVGLSVALDLVRRSLGFGLPGGASVEIYERVGADLFGGVEATHADGEYAGRAGVDVGGGYDAGIKFSRDYGGYANPSVSLEYGYGPNFELKGETKYENGKVDSGIRFKLKAGLGGGFSADYSFDLDQAVNDYRNNPEEFSRKIGNDLEFARKVLRHSSPHGPVLDAGIDVMERIVRR